MFLISRMVQAPRVDVSENFHEDTVEDPHRPLEDSKNWDKDKCTFPCLNLSLPPYSKHNIVPYVLTLAGTFLPCFVPPSFRLPLYMLFHLLSFRALTTAH